MNSPIYKYGTETQWYLHREEVPPELGVPVTHETEDCACNGTVHRVRFSTPGNPSLLIPVEMLTETQPCVLDLEFGDQLVMPDGDLWLVACSIDDRVEVWREGSGSTVYTYTAADLVSTELIAVIRGAQVRTEAGEFKPACTHPTKPVTRDLVRQLMQTAGRVGQIEDHASGETYGFSTGEMFSAMQDVANEVLKWHRDSGETGKTGDGS